MTLVIPSLRIIAVRNGQALGPDDYDSARNSLYSNRYSPLNIKAD